MKNPEQIRHYIVALQTENKAMQQYASQQYGLSPHQREDVFDGEQLVSRSRANNSQINALQWVLSSDSPTPLPNSNGKS